MKLGTKIFGMVGLGLCYVGGIQGTETAVETATKKLETVVDKAKEQTKNFLAAYEEYQKKPGDTTVAIRAAVQQNALIDLYTELAKNIETDWEKWELGKSRANLVTEYEKKVTEYKKLSQATSQARLEKNLYELSSDLLREMGKPENKRDFNKFVERASTYLTANFPIKPPDTQLQKANADLQDAINNFVALYTAIKTDPTKQEFRDRAKKAIINLKIALNELAERTEAHFKLTTDVTLKKDINTQYELLLAKPQKTVDVIIPMMTTGLQLAIIDNVENKKSSDDDIKDFILKLEDTLTDEIAKVPLPADTASPKFAQALQILTKASIEIKSPGQLAIDVISASGDLLRTSDSKSAAELYKAATALEKNKEALDLFKKYPIELNNDFTKLGESATRDDLVLYANLADLFDIINSTRKILDETDLNKLRSTLDTALEKISKKEAEEKLKQEKLAQGKTEEPKKAEIEKKKEEIKKEIKKETKAAPKKTERYSWNIIGKAYDYFAGK